MVTSKSKTSVYRKNLSEASFSSILSCPKCASEFQTANSNAELSEEVTDFLEEKEDAVEETNNNKTLGGSLNQIKKQSDKASKIKIVKQKQQPPQQEYCSCSLRGGIIWSTCEFCLTSLGVVEVRRRRFLLIMEMLYQTGISIGKLLFRTFLK